MSDAPNAKEPSKDELVIEKPVKSLGVPKIFQESRMKELRMENLALKRLREKENQLRDSLQAMTTEVEWNQPLELSLDIPEQTTAEEENQQQREMQVFAVYYVKEHMIPVTPQELETKTCNEPVNNQTFNMKFSKAFEEKKTPITTKAEQIVQGNSEPNKTMDITLALNLLQTLVKNNSETDQWKKELPKNYKTVPCKVYHGPTGHCSKGEFCHFIHDANFVGREIPIELWKGAAIRFPAPRFGPPIGWNGNSFPVIGRPNVRLQMRNDLYMPMNERAMDSLYISKEHNN
jgi:hypothetical protein